MTDALSAVPVHTEWTPQYPGSGAGNIERLLGHEGEPTFAAEDWLASTTRIGRDDTGPDSGISRVILPDGSRPLLTDHIARDVEGMLGVGYTEPMLEVLAKFLDKETRFGVQVHPAREYAQEVYHTPYGKAEAWIIVSVHTENPVIYLGWNRPMTIERWTEITLSDDSDAMLAAMNRIPVNVGDVWYVDGGWVHGAGGGLFIVEVQEPSDHTVGTERLCTNGVPPVELRGGINFGQAMGMFDYDGPTGDEFIEKARQQQIPVRKDRDGVETSLFEPWARTRFDATRVVVRGEFRPDPRVVGHLFVALDGTGTVSTNAGALTLKPGDRVFMPAGAADHEFVATPGETLNIIRCFPPVVTA
jgi:mannose-6-phosphate isomerase